MPSRRPFASVPSDPSALQYRTPVRCRQARSRAVAWEPWPPATAPPDGAQPRTDHPHAAAARALWPTGPLPIPTGTVELVRDPDDPDGVTVLVNGVPSSYLDLADPTRLVFEYMQQMAAVIDRVGDAGGPLDVVHLGAAGCALARAIDAERPGSRQLASSSTPSLPELVRGWFDLPRSPALRIRAGDARAELSTLPDASADVVVRDVFAGDTTPDHVRTREMVAQVARVLRPGGVYLANCADRPPLAGRAGGGRDAARRVRRRRRDRRAGAAARPRATATSSSPPPTTSTCWARRRSPAPSAACPRRRGCCTATRSPRSSRATPCRLTDPPA